MTWTKGQKVWVAAWRRHSKPPIWIRSEASVKSVGRVWAHIECSSPADTERVPLGGNEIDQGEFGLSEGFVFGTLQEREDFILARVAWWELRDLMRSSLEAPTGLKPEPIRALIAAVKELPDG